MTNKYRVKYDKNRPVLGFRVSPEVKDKLSGLQKDSDKTISEVAENLLTEALETSDKKPGSENGVSDKKEYDNNVFEKGFNQGFENGSKQVINDIKKQISNNTEKTKKSIKNQFKKFLEDHKAECSECGGSFLNEGFNCCPYCGLEFIKNDQEDADHPVVAGWGMEDFQIPIISDIFDYLGLTGEDEDVENPQSEDQEIKFEGGRGSMTDEEKDDSGSSYKCGECGFLMDEKFKFCPKCGMEFDYEE